MELNRLLEIAAEREICDFCPDSSDEICVKCTKVKGIAVSELREYHAAVKDALRRTAEHDKAREEGRLVELSEPMIPMMAGDDPMDTDVYCPRCEYDLSGAWIAEHPEEWKLCQCPNCGQSINDCIVISRQEAEAALSERGGEDG